MQMSLMKSKIWKNPVSCTFIRIGEESDDVEDRGSGSDPWSIASVYSGVSIHI